MFDTFRKESTGGSNQLRTQGWSKYVSGVAPPPSDSGGEISEILLSSDTCNFASFQLFSIGQRIWRDLSKFSNRLNKILKTRKVTGIRTQQNFGNLRSDLTGGTPRFSVPVFASTRGTTSVDILSLYPPPCFRMVAKQGGNTMIYVKYPPNFSPAAPI